MPREKDLKERVVVITGASSGFGRGVSLKLARAGCRLMLAARSIDSLRQLVAECEKAGGRAVAIRTDVGVREEMESLAQETRRLYGHCDIWINNAGGCSLGRFEQIDLEDHERVIRTNLMGVIYGSHLALHEFANRGEGTLINVASALGKVPDPYYASYVASKFAVVGLSAALRQELEENDYDKVNVCTVMPMSCDTPFFDHLSNQTGRVVKPVPPLYDPQEVVDTIVDLCLEPRAEVTVGVAGKIAVGLHSLAPETVEKMMGTHAHLFTFEKGLHAPRTTGSLHTASEDQRVQAGRK